MSPPPPSLCISFAVLYRKRTAVRGTDLGAERLGEWQTEAVAGYLGGAAASALPPAGSYPAQGRATPDVSALGEGYQVIVGGQVHGVGGTVRAALRWLSVLSVSIYSSILYGAFAWAHRALNGPKRRFPARAVGLRAGVCRDGVPAQRGTAGGGQTGDGLPESLSGPTRGAVQRPQRSPQ